MYYTSYSLYQTIATMEILQGCGSFNLISFDCEGVFQYYLHCCYGFLYG
jgi:hypothetical protein